jgi:hypothetical protein
MWGRDDEDQGARSAFGPCFHTIAFNGCAMAHCAGEVEWLGRYRDGNDRWFDVEACAEHAGPLVDRRKA